MTDPIPTELVRDDAAPAEQWGGSTDFLPERVAETAASTVAAQAAAQIQARYAIAMRQKRSVDQARITLLKDCQRPGFAESATYEKPVAGKAVRGFSIRFAEAAARALGNIQSDTITVYDDPDKRIIRLTVTDLESNASYGKDVSITKTVERRELRRGQVPIGKRTNSTGSTVYIVEASEDDLTVKENALVSKTLRTLLLRLVPGDIIEDCERQVMATLNDRAAKDPDAERKRLCDAFAVINVLPKDLEEWLGHELTKVVPAELVHLRKVYTAIREGEATWADVMEQRRAERGQEAQKPGNGGAATNGPAKNLADITAKLKAQQQPAAAATVAASAADEESAIDRILDAQQPPPETGTGTSQPPAATTQSSPPRAQVPLAERGLDEVASIARTVLDGAEFNRILRSHNGKAGAIGFGLSVDGQAAFKRSLLEQIERLQRPAN